MIAKLLFLSIIFQASSVVRDELETYLCHGMSSIQAQQSQHFGVGCVFVSLYYTILYIYVCVCTHSINQSLRISDSSQ
jgi:hypothetical protein